MLSETAHVRLENEATECSRYKMAASVSWVQELKSRTKSTVHQKSAEEEKEGPGQIMCIL